MSETTDIIIPEKRPRAARTGSKLGRKSECVIAALLKADTLKEAADVAGIGERTLRTWLDRPDFAAAYRAAREAVVHQAIGKLQANAGQAVKALLEIANDAGQNPVARVNASKVLLEYTLRGSELLELHHRLADVEKRLGGRQ